MGLVPRSVRHVHGYCTAQLKMYILIRESVAPGFAVLAAAHASLAAYLKFKR